VNLRHPRIWSEFIRGLPNELGIVNRELADLLEAGDEQGIVKFFQGRHDEAWQELHDFKAGHERLERLYLRYAKAEDDLERQIDMAWAVGDGDRAEELSDRAYFREVRRPGSEEEQVELDWYRDELRRRRDRIRVISRAVGRAQEIASLA
jgi:hypothetical protein